MFLIIAGFAVYNPFLPVAGKFQDSNRFVYMGRISLDVSCESAPQFSNWILGNAAFRCPPEGKQTEFAESLFRSYARRVPSNHSAVIFSGSSDETIITKIILMKAGFPSSKAATPISPGMNC